MFYEVSFHDGPTQKSIKQRPDKCSQPEPPARPGQRPGSSTWQTGWARKLKTDHFLAKMHTVIEHFHQNCTIMPKNCAEIESRNWEKVVFFPVGETLQESKAEFSFKIHSDFCFLTARAWPVLTNLDKQMAGLRFGPRIIASEQIIPFSFQFKNLSIIFAAARISEFSRRSCLRVPSLRALNIKDTQVAWLKS